MTYKFISIFLATLFSIFIVTSCDDLDNYSTNPTHTLTFSQDTLRLDTILTETGSSTRILKVYNRNSEALLISSIYLADADRSGFRMNVDGIRGNQHSNIEIRERDSLFIFLEATLPSTDNDLPVFIKDSIVFITNGVTQDVKLLAYGQDFISFRGKTITQDTIINSQRPIMIYDSLCIEANARLTLEAGVRLYFHNNADLRVRGQLIANGTLESPVQFRGDRTDNMFYYLPYDRLPGQWGGIRFYESSIDNVLNYVDIHGGQYGVRCDSTGIERVKLTLTNSIVHQVAGDALQMTDCKAFIGNSQLSNAGYYCVNLIGGDYEFVHCTLANYFSWNVKRGAALMFRNEQNGITHPLHYAGFRNCLIAGSASDELFGSRSADEEIPFNYYFSYCVINSIEEENEKILNVLWEKDDNFVLMDSRTQEYIFALLPESKAINWGLRQDAMSFPTDLRGNSRLSDDAPDAGCYEWIATGEE